MSEHSGLGDGKEIPCHSVFLSALGNALAAFQKSFEKLSFLSFLSDAPGK